MGAQVKAEPEVASLTLRTAMNLIYLYAIVSEPFIPASSKAMRESFALSADAPARTQRWASAE